MAIEWVSMSSGVEGANRDDGIHLKLGYTTAVGGEVEGFMWPEAEIDGRKLHAELNVSISYGITCEFKDKDAAAEVVIKTLHAAKKKLTDE